MPAIISGATPGAFIKKIHALQASRISRPGAKSFALVSCRLRRNLPGNRLFLRGRATRTCGQPGRFLYCKTFHHVPCRMRGKTTHIKKGYSMVKIVDAFCIQPKLTYVHKRLIEPGCHFQPKPSLFSRAGIKHRSFVKAVTRDEYSKKSQYAVKKASI
ncbi:hypothetical protein SAMN04487894_114105 [Niabella drilacis]|uniref:Uncharacterized protein n=1 Tax=Niabella drilacis (strain DSM 25811 / CCM 8410 / CCUG 62505 / LMG 26954 / E90) TaxID=1285928 RepID=A0A1G6Y3X4_NIADE|nr:hypothetical protein SAMN04487894_114105 [Niabella drilacis]